MKRLTFPLIVVLALLPREGVGQLKENFGQVPGTVGRVPGTTGQVPGTVGRVPGTVGRVPGTFGRVPGTTGRVPGTTGRVPARFGRVPHSSSYRPDEPGLERRGAGQEVREAGQEPSFPTVVIVHGAWGGGWAWREVDGLLRETGRTVYRPTLTGLGERHHLASPDIGLDTHITDVVNVLAFEELRDVVLVGHSYGGMVITGVAEQVPERISHLVYLDAFVPFDGECLRSVGGRLPERCEMGDVSDFPGEVTEEGFSVPTWAAARPFPKDVPQSFKTFLDRVELAGEPGHGVPATYVLTRDAPGQADDFDSMAERARELGWQVREMIADHNPQWSKPQEIADLLAGVR